MLPSYLMDHSQTVYMSAVQNGHTTTVDVIKCVVRSGSPILYTHAGPAPAILCRYGCCCKAFITGAKRRVK